MAQTQPSTPAQAWLKELSSTDANKRIDAALQLGQPGWSFALPELMRLAKSDPVLKVRKAAVDSLGRIDDPAAAPVLQAIWTNASEDAHLRQLALEAWNAVMGLDDGGADDTGGGASRSPDTETGGI